MYQDKVVWITGASSGIGEALAYEFARQGARLVLSARRADALEAVRKQCANPQQHLVLPLDMSDSAALPVAVQQVRVTLGRIDVLINNAGISQRSLVQDTAVLNSGHEHERDGRTYSQRTHRRRSAGI